MGIGKLEPVPALSRPELLAEPVAQALARWARAGEVGVAAIDPAFADTAALAEELAVPLGVSANCVVVAGRREGQERIAACLVLATTRTDVNNTVKRLLDVRKASFLPMERAVELTGMAYGGITPIGLPPSWRLLVDAAVLEVPLAVIGSGVRHSKLLLPGTALGELPGAEVLDGLGR